MTTWDADWDFDSKSPAHYLKANYPGVVEVFYLRGFEDSAEVVGTRFQSHNVDALPIGENAAWLLHPYYEPQVSSYLVTEKPDFTAGMFSEVSWQEAYIEVVVVTQEAYDQVGIAIDGGWEGEQLAEISRFMKARTDSDKYARLFEVLGV